MYQTLFSTLTQLHLITNRSSQQRCSVKKGVLRNFTKFTGKHLCQCLFFNKVAGLRPASLLKKRFWHRCFPVNFLKFLRTPFFAEHLWRTTSARMTLMNELRDIDSSLVSSSFRLFFFSFFIGLFVFVDANVIFF